MFTNVPFVSQIDDLQFVGAASAGGEVQTTGVEDEISARGAADSLDAAGRDSKVNGAPASSPS
jgi:hypothetical protein